MGKPTADSIFFTCKFSNKAIGFQIDSCNCDTVIDSNDTAFIDISQWYGGEIQGKLLRFNSPVCDSTYVIIKRHQNRMFTFSMGPDPVYDDWLLYTSGPDTIHYNKNRKGFFIDSIPIGEIRKFPSFDTLDFFKAYQRQVDENMGSDIYPSNAKAAQYDEYLRNKNDIKDILEQSDTELHRIILELRQGKRRIKVIVFTYGHMG